MSDDFVLVKNVTKSFGDVTALRDVTVTIERGKIFGLTGKSGSGKSILMYMLRGTSGYRPDEGCIIYRVLWCPSCSWVEPVGVPRPCPRCRNTMSERSVDFWNEGDKCVFNAIKSRVAIMLQRTFALFGDMTAIENVIEAIDDDVDHEEKVSRAADLLRAVGLSHRTTHIARNLSGGEKQRVVLARQLAKNPMLLLADEPTGTLDPKSADTIYKAIAEGVRHSGLTVVIASHWPMVIRRLADSGVWLDRGTVMKVGDSEEITDRFVAVQRPVHEKGKGAESPIVRIERVKKYYYSLGRGVVKAVDDVSFDIREGEIFGLVGWSGAGKTTLSRMISGIIPSSDGGIAVRMGDDWVDMSKKGPMGKGRVTPYIGVLHQEYSLHPYSTILENLSTSIGTRLPGEFIKIKAIDVLKGVGFDEGEVNRILHALPHTLSVGEEQRVALAQVLMKEPILVILDEPTGTLDPITKREVARSILSARAKLGETFMVVSHDTDFILDTCDRAALMVNGKTASLGSPEDAVEGLLRNRGNDHDR